MTSTACEVKSQCYVRTIKTLVIAFTNGDHAQIRRQAAPPRALRDVHGPILVNGANWQAAEIRCIVAHTNSVTCNDMLQGTHSAFVASNTNARRLP